MPDHRSLLPAANLTGPSASEHQTSDTQPLRCQWCSVPLAAGVTICPTCGSAGVADPQMSVAGLTDLDDLEQAAWSAPVTVEHESSPIAAGELVEWWNDGESVAASAGLDLMAVERRRTQSLIFIGGSVILCALLGWLIGPSLLVGPFERVTGTNVEHLSDLRTMGTIGGFIMGMFIGACGGWVIWADK
jgi:hypothetical protein